MNCIQKLPENYEEALHVDLQKDKKTALKVNGLALLIYTMLFIPAFLIRPLDLMNGVELDLVVTGVTIVAFFVYIVLHELTHGVVMKHYGGKEVNFGFTGIYAYAGSSKVYFSRNSYIVITLAPFVLWTVVFTILLLLFHKTLYWPLIFMQITHISGCAGDLYVYHLVRKLPDTLYVKDTGVEMTAYDRKDGK